jgi:C1A family cysteine protease
VLSAEYLFYHGVQCSVGKDPSIGLTFEEVTEALSKHGQPAEAEWPYSQAQPNPWIPPSVSQRWFGKLKEATADSIIAITALLRRASPVVLGLQLSSAFVGPLPADFSIRGDGAGFGGHAVLAVGLGRRRNDEQYFLIRNSWGRAWGDNGHAWLACDYLADKLIGYSSVFKL